MAAKIWTDEEIQFLKFAYPNKDFTSNEIFRAFADKTPIQVKAKAKKLGLKRYKEVLPEGFKKCRICKTILPLDDFYENIKTKDGRDFSCKVCERKRNKEYRIGKSICNSKDIKEGPIIGGVKEGPIIGGVALHKTCKKCGETKSYKEFDRNKKMKDGRLNDCKDCRSKERRIRLIKGGY